MEWPIRTDGEKESKRSMLLASFDDNDDNDDEFLKEIFFIGQGKQSLKVNKVLIGVFVNT